MRVIKDFECPSCGEEFETFVDSNDTSVGCKCGATAHSVITKMTPQFDPYGKHATTKSVLRMARQRERQIKHERKREAKNQ